MSRVASSQGQFSPGNQCSAEFTRHVLVTSAEVVLKKVPGTVPSGNPPKVNRSKLYHAVEKSH